MDIRGNNLGMTDRDRDEETGKYTIEFQDEEFIDAIKNFGGSASTTEISDFIGCDRRTAYLRLKELEKEGSITSRKVGNSLLWSATDI